MAATRPSTDHSITEDEPATRRGDGSGDGDTPDTPDTFEAAYARLEEISHQLEAGGLSLERSVDLYEEGMRLAERCQELLASVEQRIETLRQRAGGGGGGASGAGGDAGR